MVMVMVTDVIVHADFKERKGKTVDHIELSIFHQRSTDLNKNEQKTSIAFSFGCVLCTSIEFARPGLMRVARVFIYYACSSTLQFLPAYRIQYLCTSISNKSYNL